MKKKYPIVLSIAGSDPSGGAGIQADIKTISAIGAYAATAITAVVDENTHSVSGIYPVPTDFVLGQIDSVITDIGADAIKIGMLHSPELIRVLAKKIQTYGVKHIVLDPVMVATSGDSLMKQGLAEALKSDLLSLATIITPNIPEAEQLLQRSILTKEDMYVAVRDLADQFSTSVLLKSGHLQGDILTDLFYNQESKSIEELSSPRIDTKNTHGTGCTLSSAIATYLALGNSLSESVSFAKEYIYQAIRLGANYEIGKGNGPVNHFWQNNQYEK